MDRDTETGAKSKSVSSLSKHIFCATWGLVGHHLGSASHLSELTGQPFDDLLVSSWHLWKSIRCLLGPTTNLFFGLHEVPRPLFDPRKLPRAPPGSLPPRRHKGIKKLDQQIGSKIGSTNWIPFLVLSELGISGASAWDHWRGVFTLGIPAINRIPKIDPYTSDPIFGIERSNFRSSFAIQFVIAFCVGGVHQQMDPQN